MINVIRSKIRPMFAALALVIAGACLSAALPPIMVAHADAEVDAAAPLGASPVVLSTAGGTVIAPAAGAGITLAPMLAALFSIVAIVWRSSTPSTSFSHTPAGMVVIPLVSSILDGLIPVFQSGQITAVALVAALTTAITVGAAMVKTRGTDEKAKAA